MKYALSALCGACVSAFAVVLAGGRPALLVVLGFAIASGLYVLLFSLSERWSFADAVAARMAPRSGKSGESIPGNRQRQISSRPGNSETSSRRKRTHGAPGTAGIATVDFIGFMVVVAFLSVIVTAGVFSRNNPPEYPHREATLSDKCSVGDQVLFTSAPVVELFVCESHWVRK